MTDIASRDGDRCRIDLARGGGAPIHLMKTTGGLPVTAVFVSVVFPAGGVAMEGLRGPDVGSGLVLALPCCWGLAFDALLVFLICVGSD